MKADIGPDTRSYWNHQQLAEGLNWSRQHLYRLLAEGAMLGPDIVIAGNNLGWDPDRARRFGVDTDRLSADFEPLPPVEGSLTQGLAKARALVASTYRVTPQVYLSSWLASFCYDLQETAVYFMRKRGQFITADVRIAKKFGWSETRVIEFGEQTGRLGDEEIDRWAVRRTAHYGLSPEIGWVAARVEQRPWLADPLGEALEAWRRAQDQQDAS